MFEGTARFRRLDLLGQGRLGLVYRVYDEEVGQEVALKTLPDLKAEDIYYIKEEFRALKYIRHSNLVELHELIVDSNHCFFTMELVDGLPFTDYVWGQDGRTSMRRLSELGLARLRGALSGLAAGLAALHREGKLHRDVKPSNVLVTREGRVVLLDFDMVTHFGPEALRSADQDQSVGTLDYMSPEQFWNKQPLSPATDWYSVGVLLFEVLTGELPPLAEILRSKQRGPFPGLDALALCAPADLAVLVRSLLDFDPERRMGEPDVRRAAHGAAETPEPINGARSYTAPGSPFIGRARELDALRSTWEKTRRGTPAIVYVEGASGIGKSELIRRFLLSIRDPAVIGSPRGLGSALSDERRPVAILCGACHEQESVPYKALDSLVDEFSEHLVSLPSDREVPLAPRDARALTTIFPVLGRVDALEREPVIEGDIEPQELRRRGFRALRELLSQLAYTQPLVLWIDDLQWGDIDSAPFFRELLRPPDAPPLMLILSYRSEDRDQSPLLGSLRHSVEDAGVFVHRISLDPLDTGESRELAEQLLRTSPASTPTLVAAVAAQAAGSPFFLIELAQNAMEELSREEPAMPSPDRLELILQRRVTRLPERERRILEVVSIAGQADRSLVLAAAQLGQGGRPDVNRLSKARLVRAAEIGERREIEIYHDRTRQVVIATMSKEVRRQRHLEFAEALKATPSPDPEALFEHYLQAGDRASAGQFVMLAAERAAAALAFERAAERYGQALDLGAVGEARWSILAKRGEALANAGWGGRSGESFEAASAELERSATPAESGSRSRAIELRRRAAEQYLRSGHFKPGVAALSRVLRAVGLEYPSSPWRAFASMLLGRARLHARGLGFRLRSAEDVPPSELAQIDACWSAGLGLAWIDLMRTSAFQGRYTMLALEAGEPGRVARALAVEASQFASYGGVPRLRRGAKVIAAARTIAEETGDPSTNAFTTLMDASIAFYDARWRDSLDLCRRAEVLLRERCRTPVWEMTTVRLFSLSSLVHLGELAELRGSLPGLLEEATARGDLLGAASLTSGLPNILWLASDQPAEARVLVDDAIQLWSQSAYQFQHYLHLVASMHIDLYVGDGRSAWARITKAWPQLRSSFLLVCQNVRMTLLHLRARAAVAVVAEERRSGGAPRGLRRRERHACLLWKAERDAARLSREGIRWAAPLAAAVRAQVAAARGEAGEAIAALDHAARLFAGIDMALYASALRYSQGGLLGGDRGRDLRRSSEQWMQEQGVKQPGRLVSVLVPGVEP